MMIGFALMVSAGTVRYSWVQLGTEKERMTMENGIPHMTLGDLKELSNSYMKNGHIRDEDYQRVLDNRYPTLVSRLSRFFNIPQEKIREEIVQIVAGELHKQDGR